jgi:hypothetical protein
MYYVYIIIPLGSYSLLESLNVERLVKQAAFGEKKVRETMRHASLSLWLGLGLKMLVGSWGENVEGAVAIDAQQNSTGPAGRAR